ERVDAVDAAPELHPPHAHADLLLDRMHPERLALALDVEPGARELRQARALHASEGLFQLQLRARHPRRARDRRPAVARERVAALQLLPQRLHEFVQEVAALQRIEPVDGLLQLPRAQAVARESAETARRLVLEDRGAAARRS